MKASCRNYDKQAKTMQALGFALVPNRPGLYTHPELSGTVDLTVVSDAPDLIQYALIKHYRKEGRLKAQRDIRTALGLSSLPQFELDKEHSYELIHIIETP